jgi:hypothetical protein
MIVITLATSAISSSHRSWLLQNSEL